MDKAHRRYFTVLSLAVVLAITPHPALADDDTTDGTCQIFAIDPEIMSHTAEGARCDLSQTGFSPREEEILSGIAAVEGKVALAGRKLPVAPINAAVQHGNTKAEPRGTLCSVYESGGDIAAIGYDAKGGTSYGLYQITSKSGAMDLFIKYLAINAPDLATRLAEAGPENTGSKSGGMPDAWKRISAEQGKRFESLQHGFIRESHYEPAAKNISIACGLAVSNKPQALREVLWSTTVQHGVQRATKIFVNAAGNLQARGKNVNNFDRALIEEVYRLRSYQLDTHGTGRAAAVKNRLQSEKEIAVAML